MKNGFAFDHRGQLFRYLAGSRCRRKILFAPPSTPTPEKNVPKGW
jgi:hypothetical protein